MKILKWLKDNIYVIIFFICFYLLLNYELPYYILAPGGTIDISDRVSIDDSNKINGNLYLMYATEIKTTIPTYIISLFNNKWDLFDNSDRQVGNEDIDEINLRNKIMLNNSIDTATYVAYKHANKDISIKSYDHYILGVTSTSTCDFKVGDKIININNKKVEEVKEINNVITNSNINDKINFLVIRDDKEINTTCNVNEDKKIGVVIVTDYNYDLDPKITLKFKSSESGSSGGMMLALGIYSEIADVDLIKGRHIAGTGTIDNNGNIGEIGGVKYKIIGAYEKKVDLVFVPKENYEEAKKVNDEYKYNLKIISVSTFDEVINYLKENN